MGVIGGGFVSLSFSKLKNKFNRSSTIFGFENLEIFFVFVFFPYSTSCF
jgi:hypothetical protein